MMTEETFFFDTYALIEILKKNPNYERYTNCSIVINDLVFLEFCYKVYNEGIINGEDLIKEIEDIIVFPDKDICKKAMKFRLQNKKKKMSMTDCVSYIMSKEIGIKFLTGDKEFENLENVEFIKK
jgi:uncharacterized protein